MRKTKPPIGFVSRPLLAFTRLSDNVPQLFFRAHAACGMCITMSGRSSHRLNAMAISREKLFSLMARLSGLLTGERIAEELAPRLGPAPSGLKHASLLTRALIERNWDILQRHRLLDDTDRAQLADDATLSQLEDYSKNIENCVGTVKLPVGVAGPLRINGFFAKGDFHIPLATTIAGHASSRPQAAAQPPAFSGNQEKRSGWPGRSSCSSATCCWPACRAGETNTDRGRSAGGQAGAKHQSAHPERQHRSGSSGTGSGGVRLPVPAIRSGRGDRCQWPSGAEGLHESGRRCGNENPRERRCLAPHRRCRLL